MLFIALIECHSVIQERLNHVSKGPKAVGKKQVVRFFFTLDRSLFDSFFWWSGSAMKFDSSGM